MPIETLRQRLKEATETIQGQSRQWQSMRAETAKVCQDEVVYRAQTLNMHPS